MSIKDAITQREIKINHEPPTPSELIAIENVKKAVAALPENCWLGMDDDDDAGRQLVIYKRSSNKSWCSRAVAKVFAPD